MTSHSFPTRRSSDLILGALLITLVYAPFPSAYADLSSIRQSSESKLPEWESDMWIRDNTSTDARVFPLFGLYGQGFDIFTERYSIPYPNDPNAMQRICNKDIPEFYEAYWRTNAITDNYVKVLNPDSSTSYVYHNVSQDELPKKLTDFDYILVRYKGTQADPCIGYFINEMLARGDKVAWFNDQVAILEVNKHAANYTANSAANSTN
jgi:hypothetical protein